MCMSPYSVTWYESYKLSLVSCTALGSLSNIIFKSTVVRLKDYYMVAASGLLKVPKSRPSPR